MKYEVKLEPNAECLFSRIDKASQEKILKKLIQLENEKSSRHLRKGLPYFVEEVGQYRIAFKINEELKRKEIYFVGIHKEYMKWVREQELLS